jgi:hypothetical protein
MQNGDLLVMGLWYKEVIIIPSPANTNQYYVFCIGVTGNYGLYYSVVDISANGGLGAVIQKNVQLPHYFPMVDCLTAVKHGNGRDWWVLFRKSDFQTGGGNNDFYLYLITPNGLSNVIIQSVGSQNTTNGGRISFNPAGDKFAFVNFRGLIETYHFDRCTGLITLDHTIISEYPAGPYPFFFYCEYSPTGQRLYVTSCYETSYLYQFDLTAANITASMNTIWSTSYPKYAAGDVKRGDDGRIYFSATYYDGVNFPYPYPDTVYNMYNMNLGVINSPDSLGAACDFQPYSFYLGGKRTYWGLPNNPDYHLGPKVGSGCDTLLNINEHSQNLIISNLYPNPNNGEFTIHYFLPNGSSGMLEIINFQGQRVYNMHLPHYSYMQDIKLSGIAPGVYAIKISTSDKTIFKKLVVQ